jgi:lipopolysaccharide/colanic/teichoic acid biosynthesis glycosyltransferase
MEYLRSPEKRALDIAGALGLGVVAVGPCAVLSLPLALELRSPHVFLAQERLGGGRKLTVLKFQTLRGIQPGQALITHGTYDPRAGRVGGLLRQTGIDELPQVMQIVKGRMSIVGPRPMVAGDFERMRASDSLLFDEWKVTYDEMKPGLVGPSQVLRRGYAVPSDESNIGSMKADLAYAEEATLDGDVAIIIGTPLAMWRAIRQARAGGAE